MSDIPDLREILPLLDPPGGGLHRLRRTMARSPSTPRKPVPYLVLFAAAAAAVLSLIAGPPTSALRVSDDPVFAAISENPQREPLRLLATDRLAASRVPTSDAVVYFRVDGVARR